MLERPFCVLGNSHVFPLHFGCSSLKAHTCQEFPFHGKFLPERQIPIRFIFNERQLTLPKNAVKHMKSFLIFKVRTVD